MNQVIYNADRLRIRFILSYMNDGKAANWKEYYLDTLEDLVMGMPNFPTLVTFLKDVRLAFCAADRVRNAVNRLETLKLINFHNKVNTSVETLVKVNTAYSPTN
jgi:hypothetical protein